ncbi:hypothetical protein CPB85DRAFT_1252396 [Mucidula mucida]|nr:hypothetical protein CPB85DRAFT_1252396 [Mucidula mucida]
MDFLKNLSLSDKEKPQPEAPPAEPAISTAKPEPDPEHHGGFLNKIFGGEEPAPPPVAKPPAEPKRSSFIDKITGHHDDEESVAPPPPPAPEKHEASFVDKISGAFTHEEDAPPPPVPAKEEKRRTRRTRRAAQRRHHLRDIFKGESESKEAELKKREAELQRRDAELKLREEAAKAKSEHHGAELPPPKGEESLLDHFGVKFGHQHDEPPPPQGLMGRVSAILGGGPQSEKNEDHWTKLSISSKNTSSRKEINPTICIRTNDR